MNPQFTSLLAQVDVLSLDIFDTALGRRCACPEDAFAIMEEELVAAHGTVFEDFALKRRNADTLARRRAWDSRQAEEINLNDIYSVLLEQNPAWTLDAEALSEQEMAVEDRLLYPLEGAAEMIRKARAAGRKVVFISDMYLPQAFCEQKLRDNGINDYDALYLSSTIGKLKHTGKLFEHVLQDLGIQPERILHVGDNPHSDVKQAEKLGMRTLLLDKAIDRLDRFSGNPWHDLRVRPRRNSRESLLLGMSARGCLREDRMRDPFWFRIGYQVGGPLIYGYVRFLVGKLRGSGIPRVYFLSRDGYILKQVYEIITTGMDDCPKADYLHASRRSLNFASITELDPKTEDWLAEGINLTVADFLRRIGLDPGEHAAAIREAGFSGADQAVVGGHEYGFLRKLYHHILPAIRKAAEKERTTYLAYLRQKKVFDAKPFVMVDVGWMTSIQRSFEKLLHTVDPELEIEGYYLGTYPEAIQRAGPLSRHNHYLMAYGNPEAAMRTIRHSVCLVEFFFAAPERTFLYMEGGEESGFSPVLAPMHENEEDLPALAEIHAGVLEYTREILPAGPAPGPEIEPREVLALLDRLLANPTREEAERLGELKYADGYGSFFHHTCMARPGGLGKLGLSKRRWKREFKTTHWPKGYYSRLGKLEQFLFRRFHPAAKFSKPHG